MSTSESKAYLEAMRAVQQEVSRLETVVAEKDLTIEELTNKMNCMSEFWEKKLQSTLRQLADLQKEKGTLEEKYSSISKEAIQLKKDNLFLAETMESLSKKKNTETSKLAEEMKRSNEQVNMLMADNRQYRDANELLMKEKEASEVARRKYEESTINLQRELLIIERRMSEEEIKNQRLASDLESRTKANAEAKNDLQNSLHTISNLKETLHR